MISEDIKVGIAGMGFYFPKTLVNTKELADENNLPEKVYNYIGVEKIYKPSEDDQPTKMAYESAVKSLKDARISADKIDLIVVSGAKYDYLHWQMGGWLKDKLKAKNAMTMEVRGGCGAHFQAVEIAVDQMRASADVNTVLVVSGERLYGYGWPSFLSSGGQSIVLKKNCDDFNYLGFNISNYIIYHDMAHIPHGGVVSPFTPDTDWKGYGFVENVEVNRDMYFEHIKPVFFDKFIEVTDGLLKKTCHKLEDINYVITLVQQQNFDERIQEALKIPNIPNANEFKADIGHFSGADIYILLDKAKKNGRIKKGDIILAIVVGGVAWYASLIEY